MALYIALCLTPGGITSSPCNGGRTISGSGTAAGTSLWGRWHTSRSPGVIMMRGAELWGPRVRYVCWFIKPTKTIAGWWWLEHEFYVSNIWRECHHPNWQTHIFQRGCFTMNQYSYLRTIDHRYDRVMFTNWAIVWGPHIVWFMVFQTAYTTWHVVVSCGGFHKWRYPSI